MNKILLTSSIILFITLKGNAQNSLLFGGGISLLAPTNTFNENDFGFNDVANIGGGLNASSLWFFNPQLSLGSELSYSYFPKDKKTWNQDSKGEIKVNYQMVNLTAQGNFYLNEDEIRPYLGVAFGLYYLRNKVNFDSKYTGTTNDASVSYISESFHAGFGPELGLFFELNKRQYATISLRYTVIPNIEKEEPINGITKNPHGKQNHWGLTGKLFFGR